MTTRTALRAATLTLAMLACSLTPTAAQATTLTDGYMLSLTPVEPGAELPTRTTALWCHPTGGPHPKAAKACRQLTAARGHIHRIPADPGPCTLEYAPVRLIAIGLWDGRVRRHHSIHANRCVAIRDTGGAIAAF